MIGLAERLFKNNSSQYYYSSKIGKHYLSKLIYLSWFLIYCLGLFTVPIYDRFIRTYESREECEKKLENFIGKCVNRWEINL